MGHEGVLLAPVLSHSEKVSLNARRPFRATESTGTTCKFA